MEPFYRAIKTHNVSFLETIVSEHFNLSAVYDENGVISYALTYPEEADDTILFLLENGYKPVLKDCFWVCTMNELKPETISVLYQATCNFLNSDQITSVILYWIRNVNLFQCIPIYISNVNLSRKQMFKILHELIETNALDIYNNLKHILTYNVLKSYTETLINIYILQKKDYNDLKKIWEFPNFNDLVAWRLREIEEELKMADSAGGTHIASHEADQIPAAVVRTIDQ